MAKDKREVTRRAVQVMELRAEDTEDGRHIVRGHAISYGEHALIANEFDEVIMPGALDNTDISDVALLINHNANGVAIARSKNGKGTLKLEPVVNGLDIEADLDVDHNPDAAAVYSAIKRGDVGGVSFAFVIREGGQQWEFVRNATNPPFAYRKITDIEVIHEISIVNYPAYKGTSIVATRSEEETLKRLEETRAAEIEADVIRLKNENNILLI